MPFFDRALRHPKFIEGDFDTGFVARLQAEPDERARDADRDGRRRGRRVSHPKAGPGRTRSGLVGRVFPVVATRQSRLGDPPVMRFLEGGLRVL